MSIRDHTQTDWRRYLSSSSTGTLFSRRRSRTRHLALEFLESRQLLSTTPPITEYPTPSVPPQPTDVVSLDGKLWFTVFGNAIGSLDPTTSPPTINSYSQGLPGSSGPESITVGPDGQGHQVIWFTELIAGQIGTLDPTNPKQGIVNYGTTQGMLANAEPYGITTGPDGQGHQVIWFTDVKNNALGELNPATGTIQEFPVTTPQHPLIGFTTFDSVITAGPGGKLYFTEAQFGSGSSITASGIGIYDPSTQTWSQVTLPSGSNQEPFGLTVGPDGNIWFSEGIANSGGTGFQSSGLGILSLSSSPPTLSEPAGLSVSGTSAPYQIVTGPDDNIWFTLPSAGQIGEVQVKTNPANDTISTFPIPSSTQVPTPDPSGIMTGPDGNVWFADASGAVGRVTLDTKLVITTQPPATVTPGSPFGLTAKVEYSDTNAVDTAYTGNVSIALTIPASNTLGGTTTMPVTTGTGVATLTKLTLANPGTGFTLTATAGSLTSAPSAGINVTTAAPQATQLFVYSQPTAPVTAGSPFSLVIDALTSSKALASSYSGTVTLTLAAYPPGGSLGGTTTVTASGGIARFPTNLTLNLPGTYVIQATASGLSSVSTTAITVPNPPPPPAPQVQSPQSPTVVTTQKRNKRGNPIGRPVLSGYQFTFNMAMNPSTTGFSSNYIVQNYVQVRVKVGKRYQKQLQLRPIGFSLQYPSNNTVKLITGKQAFKYGGQITLVASPPTGISSAAGAFLNTSYTVYNIARGGMGISPA